MKTITKIGVMSIAKLQAVITGAAYLIMSLLANIVGLKNPEIIQSAGIQTGISALASYTLSGIIGGFVIGALIACLYNTLAPKLGGVQVEIKEAAKGKTGSD